MNDKEKRIIDLRGKVRKLYVNSGYGMEEILRALIDDACYFTQYDDVLYEFWIQIERDLNEWIKKNSGETLKINIAGYEKGIPKGKAFISQSVMS